MAARSLSPEQQQLVEANMGLVHHVIGKFVRVPYWHWRVEKDDLIQTGYLALCKAALAYSPEKGDFPAFAGTSIRNALIYEIGRIFGRREEPTDDESIFAFDRAHTTPDVQEAVCNRIFLEMIFDDDAQIDRTGLGLIMLREAGFSVLEITKQTNLTSDQVYRKISGARKAIRKKYSEYNNLTERTA